MESGTTREHTKREGRTRYKEELEQQGDRSQGTWRAHTSFKIAKEAGGTKETCGRLISMAARSHKVTLANSTPTQVTSGGLTNSLLLSDNSNNRMAKYLPSIRHTCVRELIEPQENHRPILLAILSA